MSRWFRHYAGMMRDERLVSAAVRSKQPVERVVWVWGAVLESAAEINDAGRYEFDAGEAAYFLRCDETDLFRIVECLNDLGRISGGMVVRWSERQFDSDSAKERQRRYRERVKARDNVQELHNDVGKASSSVTRDDHVTSRDGGVTAQEAETDTDTEDVGADAPTSPEPEKSAPVAEFSPTVIELPSVSGEPYPISEADVAEWHSAFPAVDIRQQLSAMRQWLIANPTRRKTRKGMRRFVVAWLDRKQNSAHSPPAQRTSTDPPHPMHRVNAILDEIQGKPHAAQSQPHTIDSSFERADRSSAPNLVQLHAVPAWGRS